ncbi:MAG: ribonuclease R [Verrucomicrobia bacterium 13_1_20CM_4_55_9]|nr:MAG: ribonuclease R [Verrucomicrobia bacterium 13_1_20CM_4_55_9]
MASNLQYGFANMTKNGRTIREKLLALLRMPDYRPSDRNEIARALRLQGRDRVEVRKTLRELEHAGEIVRIRKNRYVLPSEADLVTGKLSIHQAGYGFLVPEKPGEQDIFIAAENTGTAMNGDRVVARISRDVPPRRAKVRAGQASQHRSEGRVIRILERARDTIVGTLQQTRNFYYVVPDDPRLVHDVYVQVPPRAKLPKPPRRDDKVVVRLEAWESRHVNPEGEIIEILGAATAPGIDMLSIIRKYDLPTEFPKSVLDEANRIPQTVEQKLIQEREDLRDQFIVTIDPDDARDFDDAINVEKIDHTGGWRLGVHIADVSAYVTPESALDREARRRGNSVYLPDRVIPMLPERLSNGVCSLNPGVDRLTHSVFIELDKSGRAKNARFAKSVIRSAKRLTYKEAYAILQAKPNGELSRRLHTAWELASLLRRKRFEHGSLDLDFPEVKVHVDANGKPTRLERVENDQSHQLIEEFMLAANEAVARELRHRSIATIYRVHEDPDPEKLGEYREFILSFGYKVGDLSHRKEVQRFLASIKGKPEEQALKIGLLKSLKRARYAAQPLGHYGLAKAHYLHFTSPIRRYADFVVHRTLAERNLPRRSKIDIGQIESLANHISDTERNAAEAEIESVRLKKLQFFEQQLKERNPEVFRAAIMDVRNYGLVVELPDALVTGVVHVSTLSDDFYRFDAAQRRLVGRRTNRRFSVGDEIRVFVARVDTFKRQIDFAIADQSTKGRPRRR